MHHEKLSALLDDECTSEELDALLEAIEHQPELLQRWSRHCLGHELCSGRRVPAMPADFVAGVMRAVAVQQNAVSVKTTAAPAQVPAVSSRRGPRRRLRPVAAWGIAASVAVLAVTLGLRLGSQDAASDQPLVAQADEPALAAGVDEDLNQYLLEHSNVLADRGVGGALSYARFAARSADTMYAQPVNLRGEDLQP